MTENEFVYLARVSSDNSSRKYEDCMLGNDVTDVVLGQTGGDTAISGQNDKNINIETVPMSYFFGGESIEEAIDNIKVLASELTALGAIKQHCNHSSNIDINDTFIATKSTLLILKIPTTEFKKFKSTGDIVSYTGTYGLDSGEQTVIDEFRVSSDLLKDILCNNKEFVEKYGKINDVIKSAGEVTIQGLKPNYTPSITIGLDNIKHNSANQKTTSSTPSLIAKQSNGKIIFEIITPNNTKPSATVQEILDWVNNDKMSIPMSEKLEMLLGSMAMSGYKFEDNIDRKLIGLKPKKKPSFDDTYYDNNYQSKDDYTDDDTPNY